MDDDVESDQRLEHQRHPAEFVSLAELFALTGVEYFKVSEANQTLAHEKRSRDRFGCIPKATIW